MWEPPEYPGPCFDLHFGRFDGFIFEAEKTFRKRVRYRGLPSWSCCSTSGQYAGSNVVALEPLDCTLMKSTAIIEKVGHWSIFFEAEKRLNFAPKQPLRAQL